MTLTLIGTGKMALALAKGLQHHYDLEIVGRSEQKAKAFLEDNAIKGSAYAMQGFSIEGRHVILLVKPYALEPVATQLSGKADTLYSVLAGTTIEALHFINASHYVRTMANVAAMYNASMTTITGDVTKAETAKDIFSTIGKTLWVNTEKELDIATGLAGSGPAYLCLIAEALADGAVKQGLKRDDAMALTRGLFEGFAPLLQHDHPALIKDAVMSPGGTTAAGYDALEQKAVRAACMNAIEQAYKKTLK